MKYHRIRPSRSIQYEKAMSTATQPSSLGLTTTRRTQEQQGLADAAIFTSNAASVQHDRYKGPSLQSQDPFEGKHFGYKLKQMEQDLLGVGSHTSPSGNVQDGPHAPCLELFGCPHHCPISPGTLASLGSRQLSPMERFRIEGSSERYAILSRPDIGDTSTYRCSQCKKTIQARVRVGEDNMRA